MSCKEKGAYSNANNLLKLSVKNLLNMHIGLVWVKNLLNKHISLNWIKF